MATIEGDLYTYLTTTLTTVAAYVGNDVYYGASPSSIETDFIRYQIISPSNEPYAFSSSNTAQPEIQIDIFSKEAAHCIEIGNLIATALNRFVGSLAAGGINVIFSTAAGPMVQRDPDEQWYHGIVTWNPEYER
jgi:putative hemolysin